MSKFRTEAIRTIALVGHGASGKTTLTESLLFAAGAINAPGSVDRGTTVGDADPLEKAHHHSMASHVVNYAYKDTHVYLIDTPGFPDFVGPAMTALDAVETVAVVINAQNGIELTTQRMMRWAADRKLCRMIIVNKIDGDNVNLPALLADIQETFGKECLPINLPAKKATQVVDCFFTPNGDADFSSVKAAHDALVDQVVEVDEKLMALYLEQGEEIKPEQLHAPFEQALREGHLVPVCFVSARSGAGVKELLEVFSSLAPNPFEGNPPLYVKGEGDKAEPFRSEPDAKKHVLAHVFKVVMDPFVGKLGVFRVHQGTVTRDTQLFVGDGSKPFKVGHLFVLQGKQYTETDQCVPGDIGAVAKVDEIEFDCVLHDSHDEDHIHLRPLEFPKPMYGLAVEPKRRGDEQKIFEVLAKIRAEDPCFTVERHPSTNETVIFGLGELHLRMILERMSKQYSLEVATKPPKIPYRETITGKAEGHHRHKKQTGGAGQFGEVFLRIEPLPRGTGFEFVDDIYGGAIPHQFVPAVEKGVRQVLDAGPLAGFPVVDVRVTVYDGKHHPVDSKEIAFVTAARKAFMDAISKARPIVLEPVVNIEVLVPTEQMGDVNGDISSRRGQLTGTDTVSANMIAVKGQVPLVEVSEYQSRLKALTGGRGSYSLELSHYDMVPPTTQRELVAAHKPKHEED